MTKSRLQDWTEPAVFVPEVAKQHDLFAGAIVFGCTSACSPTFFDWIITVKCFNEDLLNLALVPPADNAMHHYKKYNVV